MIIDEIRRRTWAEIDLNIIEENFRNIKYPKVCCVVKADAYGHGAIALAKFYQNIGAYYFAVSNIEEAIQLRINGIIKPILILGYTHPKCAKELSKYNIDQCVYSLEYAKELNKEAGLSGVKINAHIKIDTGMGRIGFQYHDNHNELEDVIKVSKLDNINCLGIFMHFSSADLDENYTRGQYKYFIDAIKYLEEKGIKFNLHHCANSAAIMEYPEFKLGMVRAGIILYGLSPFESDSCFKEALTLKSVISNLKVVHKGDSISYGRRFIATSDMLVATVPIGYADGYYRSNRGNYVMINGEKCDILGTICMDQMMVKVNKAKIGDEVIIYGNGNSINDVAKYNNTISYEVLCSIGKRVPRVYKYNGEIIEIKDDILNGEEL